MIKRNPQIHIRIPEEVKAWLENSARKNERTMNSEVVFLLKQEMEKEKASEQGLENRSDASKAE